MTPRSFLIDTKRHPEASFPRSKASEGNLIPPNPSILTVRGIGLKSSECASHKEVDPFSPDIPIRNPNPDSEIEDDRDPIDEPILPEDPGDVPPEETRPRYLLGPCMHERHTQCPGFKIREVFRFGRPTGKTERKFCECPCHAVGRGKE
jgi:hypothetical protein